MEYSEPPAVTAHHAGGLWTFLRLGDPALHHLSLLRHGRVQLLLRIDGRGDAGAGGQRAHLYEGQCPEVPVPAAEKYADADQFWHYTLRMKAVIM